MYLAAVHHHSLEGDTSMSSATGKMELGLIDGTPVKRMFWSIISDYDLRTGVCELIDNAIDLWTQSQRRRSLQIHVNLDAERQFIEIIDNAGGVRRDDLPVLIAPGGSRNDPQSEVIGIFGVGGKRASVALGEQVEIRTRFKSGETLQLDISKDWLSSESWELPAYQIPNIQSGTTKVEISRLRKPIDDAAIQELTIHISQTYGWFLQQGCQLFVNGTAVAPVTFDSWAYPRNQEPRRLETTLHFSDQGDVRVEVTGGLILDRDAEKENYGAYFYCNDRLIVKELRTRDVGYLVSGEAGVPHPDASLCRVIVRLNGPAQLMPWNSMKNGLNVGHATFLTIRPAVIQLTSHYSSLSRRLKKNWVGAVFSHVSGEIRTFEIDELINVRKIALSVLPIARKTQLEKLKQRNRSTIKNMPWTLGLVEAMSAVDISLRQKFETKNRIALVLLDSNFEIALKEFIVHRTDLYPASKYNNAKIEELFRDRPRVIAEVVKHVPLETALLARINHFYQLRNKFIHERATVEATDADIENYKGAIQEVLLKLFGLRF